MDNTRILHFRVTDEEYDTIMQKMQQCNIQNLSAYLRKMAIDGMIINLDIPELKEISRLLGCNSRNTNQIAKQFNSGSKGIYAANFADICDKQGKDIGNGSRRLFKAYQAVRGNGETNPLYQGSGFEV